MKKKPTRLTELAYGTVVRYQKQLWFKSRGLDGDIMTNLHGQWRFIEGGGYAGERDTINWKTFKIEFSPKP